MNKAKFFGGVGMFMFIMWLLFWVLGSWHVKNSFATFSYVWLAISVVVLIAVNCKLTAIHRNLSK